MSSTNWYSGSVSRKRAKGMSTFPVCGNCGKILLLGRRFYNFMEQASANHGHNLFFCFVFFHILPTLHVYVQPHVKAHIPCTHIQKEESQKEKITWLACFCKIVSFLCR